MEEDNVVPQNMGGFFSPSKYDLWKYYFDGSLSDLLSNESTCTWNPIDLAARASNIADAAMAEADMAKDRYK